MRKESKLKKYLTNIKIKRWYDNVARGSISTADVYLRRVIAVCEQLEKTPEKLLDINEEDLYHILLDFVSSEEKRGMKGSYIETSIKAVKSWLAHNRKFIQGKIKIKNARKAPTLENERVPTIEELRRIFLSSSTRDRVSCALVAHSGVRLEVLGDYKGLDGLMVKDFPEMKIIDDKIEFEKIPSMVIVRSELSKAGHKYFTFVSEEACEYIKQYLEERMMKGETISEDTDIITPKSANKRFIRTINIGDGIRKSIRSAGYPWRPYVLRSFFDTQLLLAESKGKITPAYRAFFMGHVGDIESRYTTHKCKLPPDMVEDMREAYRNSMVFLQTIHTTDEDKEMINFRKNLLRFSGVSEDEINGLDVETMDNDDIMEYLKRKMMNLINENGTRQKIIQMDEMEQYIKEGWEYIDTLPGDRSIIKLPF